MEVVKKRSLDEERVLFQIAVRKTLSNLVFSNYKALKDKVEMKDHIANTKFQILRRSNLELAYSLDKGPYRPY